MLEKITPPIPLLIKDLGTHYPSSDSKRKRHYGLYMCHCGVEFKTHTDSIKSGNTKSCGCHRDNQRILSNTTHGLTNHRLYSIWNNILARILNINNHAFKRYGGRGIAICDEWRNDFKSFYDWAMNNGYSEYLTIDRIDNDGDYEPNNCRWVKMSIQAQNTTLIRSNNTSGYRGVHWNKSKQKWEASICYDRLSKHIGTYNTAIEAAKAYDSFVISNNLEHPINGA